LIFGKGKPFFFLSSPADDSAGEGERKAEERTWFPFDPPFFFRTEGHVSALILQPRPSWDFATHVMFKQQLKNFKFDRQTNNLWFTSSDSSNLFLSPLLFFSLSFCFFTKTPKVYTSPIKDKRRVLG